MFLDPEQYCFNNLFSCYKNVAILYCLKGGLNFKKISLIEVLKTSLILSNVYFSISHQVVLSMLLEIILVDIMRHE